jgi:hypothetical protein
VTLPFSAYLNFNPAKKMAEHLNLKPMSYTGGKTDLITTETPRQESGQMDFPGSSLMIFNTIFFQKLISF